uniref:GP117 n=1 Tax=Caviid herpesvirus 2 str. CIDMTR TaxID=1415526 RepID=U6H6G5_9BETA|nr:GP117 [Caviid herpesvirus 2 str. CIDMTR]
MDGRSRPTRAYRTPNDEGVTALFAMQQIHPPHRGSVVSSYINCVSALSNVVVSRTINRVFASYGMARLNISTMKGLGHATFVPIDQETASAVGAIIPRDDETAGNDNDIQTVDLNTFRKLLDDTERSIRDDFETLTDDSFMLDPGVDDLCAVADTAPVVYDDGADATSLGDCHAKSLENDDVSEASFFPRFPNSRKFPPEYREIHMPHREYQQNTTLETPSKKRIPILRHPYRRNAKSYRANKSDKDDTLVLGKGLTSPRCRFVDVSTVTDRGDDMLIRLHTVNHDERCASILRELTRLAKECDSTLIQIQVSCSCERSMRTLREALSKVINISIVGSSQTMTQRVLPNPDVSARFHEALLNSTDIHPDYDPNSRVQLLPVSQNASPSGMHMLFVSAATTKELFDALHVCIGITKHRPDLFDLNIAKLSFPLLTSFHAPIYTAYASQTQKVPRKPQPSTSA